MKLKTLKNIYFKWIPNLLILGGLFVIAFPFLPVIRDEVWYFWKENIGKIVGKNVKNPWISDSPFGNLLYQYDVKSEPVNRSYSIVIDKLGINAPVVKDVPITDEKAYKDALKHGVAHSNTSAYPSQEAGNTYIFAHASVNFWELGKYATVFNLLRKLELNDTIDVYYEGTKYVYRVVNEEIYDGWNTYPIERSVIEPVLTLQTCDPPGTTLNRLVVTAVLDHVE